MENRNYESDKNEYRELIEKILEVCEANDIMDEVLRVFSPSEAELFGYEAPEECDLEELKQLISEYNDEQDLEDIDIDINDVKDFFVDDDGVLSILFKDGHAEAWDEFDHYVDVDYDYSHGKRW